MDINARYSIRKAEWTADEIKIKAAEKLEESKVFKKALQNLPNIIKLMDKHYSNYPIAVSKELFNYIYKNTWEYKPYTYLEHRVIISPILNASNVFVNSVEFDLLHKYAI
jgi:hypothetical protein